MIKASPGRGVITEFVANTEEDSFAHFLTYNTERTISIWKIKVPSEGRIELDLIENIELRQPPSHIAFRGNSIALATENYLVTLQVSFANRGKSSVNMFKHSKDEAHQKSITQVRILFSLINLSTVHIRCSDGTILSTCLSFYGGQNCSLLFSLKRKQLRQILFQRQTIKNDRTEKRRKSSINKVFFFSSLRQ